MAAPSCSSAKPARRPPKDLRLHLEIDRARESQDAAVEQEQCHKSPNCPELLKVVHDGLDRRPNLRRNLALLDKGQRLERVVKEIAVENAPVQRTGSDGIGDGPGRTRMQNAK